MAHPPETITAVRSTYVFQAKSLELAAKLASVPVATARRWKGQAKANGDDWDEARAANRMAAGNMDEVLMQLVNDFVILHQSLVKQLKEAKDMQPQQRLDAFASLSDAFSKMMASSRKASPRINELSVAMDVVTALGDFITEQFPENALAFSEILDKFGPVMSQRLKQKAG